MTVVERISAHLGKLSAGPLRVARFLLDQPHRVGHLSAAKIAEETGVSDATVIRTVKSLGFGSLAELREAVADELSAPGRLVTTLRGSPAGPPAVERLLQRRVDDVVHLAERLGPDALPAAVRVLARAKRVTFVGFGPSGFFAGYAAHQARRLGLVARAITATGSDLADELLDIDAREAFVVLSYDPPGGVVESVLAEAAAVGAPVVLVTDQPRPRLATPAVVLLVGRGDPTEVASHAATTAALETLLLAVAARHEGRAEAAADRLRTLRASIRATGRARQ